MTKTFKSGTLAAAFLGVRLEGAGLGGREGPRLVMGHRDRATSRHAGCLSVPASAPDRCAIENVGTVVLASPLGADDSMPGAA